MAGYTDVSFEELERFLAAYDIGVPLTFKGIAEGVENSNYFLATGKGSFILTLYEKRVKAEDLPFFLGLLEHLSAHGIACPLPVRNLSAAQLSTLGGRPAALFTFLNGVSLRRPETAHCAAAGAALAKMHDAGKGFALRRKNALSHDGWSELVEACVPRADEVEPGLAELISTAHAEITANWPSGLPEGVIHADLFPDNVLFMGGEVSGLIDFYFACNDAFAYDLAVMLNAWCFEPDVAFNVTKSKSLIAAYAKHRTLSAAEREAIPVLACGAALRFLLTRLFDWLNRDPTALVRPKDPRDYSRRLRFHRKVRGGGEYGL